MKKPNANLYNITAISESCCDDEAIAQDIREATLRLRARDIAEAVKLAQDHLGPDYEVRNVNRTDVAFVFK